MSSPGVAGDCGTAALDRGQNVRPEGWFRSDCDVGAHAFNHDASRGCYLDPAANANCHARLDADRLCYAHADRYADADRHCYADADCYTDADGHPNADADADIDCYRYTEPHANAVADADRYRYAEPHANAVADGDCNRCADKGAC